jgi:hypothetical protein
MKGGNLDDADDSDEPSAEQIATEKRLLAVFVSMKEKREAPIMAAEDLEIPQPLEQQQGEQVRNQSQKRTSVSTASSVVPRGVRGKIQATTQPLTAEVVKNCNDTADFAQSNPLTRRPLAMVSAVKTFTSTPPHSAAKNKATFFSNPLAKIIKPAPSPAVAPVPVQSISTKQSSPRRIEIEDDGLSDGSSGGSDNDGTNMDPTVHHRMLERRSAKKRVPYDAVYAAELSPVPNAEDDNTVSGRFGYDVYTLNDEFESSEKAVSAESDSTRSYDPVGYDLYRTTTKFDSSTASEKLPPGQGAPGAASDNITRNDSDFGYDIYT